MLVCAMLALSFFPARIGMADDLPQALVADLGDIPNGGDDKHVEVLALLGQTYRDLLVGGSTDNPGVGQGHPPWTKTGNIRCTWGIQGSRGLASMDDGDISTEPSNTAYSEMAGTFEEIVSYQEEYQDSSDPPNRVYWPQ